MALVVAGCTSESVNEVINNNEQQTTLVPVTVSVGGFSVSQEDFPAEARTRAAADVADYSGVKALTLAFYNGETETYKQVQLRGSLAEGETFGQFALSLPMGSYTMVIVGHGINEGEPAVTLTSPTTATFGDKPARETFVTTQTVNINSTAAVDISATLNRVISRLQVASSDVRTEGAQSVRMTLAAGGKSFNPTTGLATDNSGFSNAVNISTAVGAASLSNTYLFLASDEQTMNVTIEMLDADGNVLFSKFVENVPFKRNRITRLTGAMYTNTGIGGSFKVETDWLDQYNMGF